MVAGSKRTVDEKARIRASTDLTCSMCVEAGAGTGKTTILVSRFLSIIEEGLARCSRIVAITFTEKAAAEMKMRLREKIEERLLSESLDDTVRARLQNALYELERSVIGTIHSFAATILREFPLEAGVDPYFTQLDDLEYGVLFDRSWEDFIEALSEEDQLTVRWYLILGGSAGKLKELARYWYSRRVERYTTGIFKKRAVQGKSGDGREGGVTRPLSEVFSLAEEFTGYLKLRAGELSSMADSFCIDSSDKGYIAISDFARSVELLQELEGEELVQFLLSLNLPKNKGNKSNWEPPGKCTEQKEIFKEIIGRRDEFAAGVMDILRDNIESMLERFAQSIERAKAAKGALDFDDLLIKARRLLENREVREQVADRYRFILVDEFQDTDPIQSEIVYLLSLGKEPGEKGECGIVRGKLFIVGDPKQSIYRFRGADVEVYERFKDRLSDSGEILKIVQNFRSVPGIVNWVNSVFSNVIRAPDDGRYQSEYEPIHPYRDGTGVSIVYLDIPPDESSTKADEVRMAEAEAIARCIYKLVGSGYRVFDRHKGGYVPIEYRHIAVIYPTTTGIEHYEEILRFEQIPYIVEGGKLYFARQEVRELATAMWAIEDPDDSLAVVATLRSSLFGFSDEELFLYKRKTGGFKPVEEGTAEDERFSLMRDALRLLGELHERRNVLGAHGVMKGLIDATNFMELSLIRPHGEQKVLNIKKALHKAREFDATGYPFRRFARWFSEQERELYAEGESPVVEDDENAVRLLTMHKAKGLQFPVVIMANLVQRAARSSSAYIVDGSRLEFKLNGSLATSGFLGARDIEKKREIAEKARLLYVAATRAQDILVLPVHRNKGESYINLISRYLPQVGDDSVRRREGDSSGSPSENEADVETGKGSTVEGIEIETWTPASLPPLKGAKKTFVRMPSLSDEDERAARERKALWLKEHAEVIEKGGRSAAMIISATALESGAHRETFSTGYRSSVDRDLASRIGTAFHRVMEILDFERKGDSSGVVAKICMELDLEDHISEVEGLVDRALGSDVLKSVLSSENFYREVPFLVPLDDLYISGRIDLLFRDDGCWNVLDYKTDIVEPGDVEARGREYELQAGIYALALQRLRVGPIGRVIIYFVRADASKVFDSPEKISRVAEEHLKRIR